MGLQETSHKIQINGKQKLRFISNNNVFRNCLYTGKWLQFCDKNSNTCRLNQGTVLQIES